MKRITLVSITMLILMLSLWFVVDLPHKTLVEKAGSIKTEADTLQITIKCSICKGVEVFTILNVGQSNVLDQYETSYFCSECDTIRNVIFEIE